MFRAYAKINLGLYIVERRADGFHAIETVFHRINCWDAITFTPDPEITVESSSPDAPDGASNICHKAAVLIRNQVRTDRGVRITIRKNIPVGAGLGGGSADAALVLRALPAFWGHSVGHEFLHSFAAQLGSDVPFFLSPGSAVGRGRGEILEHFPLDIPWTILVCTPPIHVSTAWAYGVIRPRAEGVPRDLKSAVAEGVRHPERLAGILRNDFEDAVFAEYPAIRAVKEAMLSGGALYALMSGSGSSVFGLFHDERQARDVGNAFLGQSYGVSITPPHFSPGDDV